MKQEQAEERSYKCPECKKPIRIAEVWVSCDNCDFVQTKHGFMQDEHEQEQIEERSYAVELMVLINYLHRMSAMPKVSESVRRQAINLVEKMEAKR